MTSILLILTAAFGLIAWLDPKKGLLLLVALLPSYLLRGEIFGIPTTLLEMMIVVFIVIWLIRRAPSIKTILPDRRYLLPITLLFIAATLSLFVAPETQAAAGVWKAYFIEPFLLFLIVRYELSRSSIATEDIFKALGITALVLSLVAIYQWATGSGIPIPWDIEKRVTSVFDYPNALGLFLGPIVIIGAMHTRQVSKQIHTWFWPAVTILSFIAILLAQSEAAIVAIVATLAIVGLLNKKTVYTTVVACLVALMLITLSPWSGAIFDKLTLQDYSGQVRLTGWSETVNLLQDNWVLGTGLSGYPVALIPYHQATHLEIFQYPHNIVLNIWTELGLLGLVASILLAWKLLMSFRASEASRGIFSPQTIALLVLLEMTIHGLVDVPYFKNDLAILTWIMIAIAIYVLHSSSQKKS